MGRPIKPAHEGKRNPLNLRTTAAIRSRIAECAAASGRSLASEVEHRLEKSFANEDLLSAIREIVRSEIADAEASRRKADCATQYPGNLYTTWGLGGGGIGVGTGLGGGNHVAVGTIVRR